MNAYGHTESRYQSSFEREAAEASYSGSAGEFLRTLEPRRQIERATIEQLARVAELTMRTSQMNATGVHYSDGMLRGLLADPDHEVLVATMSDRFGQYGTIGVILVALHRKVWNLKLLATSCRVVSLGAGATIINWLVEKATRAEVHLAADFRPTDRDRMMEIAYRFAGFENSTCGCLSTLAESGTEGLPRLHLVPQPGGWNPVVSLSAPELGASEGSANGSTTVASYR